MPDLDESGTYTWTIAGRRFVASGMAVECEIERDGSGPNDAGYFDGPRDPGWLNLRIRLDKPIVSTRLDEEQRTTDV